MSKLREEILAIYDTVDGDFAVGFKDLTTGDTLFIHGDSSYHAASTMKTPVMVEVFRQAAAGKFRLTDSVELRNEFHSIVDGSPYSLNAVDDSDTVTYKHLGEQRTIYDLMVDMIIVSSNFATNLVIDIVGAQHVEAMLRQIGTKNIHVLRGVEDTKAFRAGLNNTTTARDQVILYEQIASNTIADSASCAAMMKVLLDQRFTDILPERLPADVRVAHKSGSITGVQHDGGIILLPDGRRYILILLSDHLTDAGKGIEGMAKVSEVVYQFVVRK
ncbi:MAG: serine hydrolase [Bacteroidota bacterium]